MSREAFIAQKDRRAADAASSGTWWDDASVDLPVSEEDRAAALKNDPLAEHARPPASPAGVLLAPTGSTLLAAVRAGGGGGKGWLLPSFYYSFPSLTSIAGPLTRGRLFNSPPPPATVPEAEVPPARCPAAAMCAPHL